MHLEEYSNLFLQYKNKQFPDTRGWNTGNTCFQAQAKLYLKMIENCGPAVTSHTIHNRRACIYLRIFSSYILVQVDWGRLDFQPLVNTEQQCSFKPSIASWGTMMKWNCFEMKWELRMLLNSFRISHLQHISSIAHPRTFTDLHFVVLGFDFPELFQTKCDCATAVGTTWQYIYLNQCFSIQKTR